MTIQFQFVKLDRSETLEDFAKERLQKLALKYDSLINAQVFFKENNSVLKEKMCDIEISLPGPTVFATSTEKHFETAVNETIRDLEKQLKKRKALTFKTNF